MVLQETNQIQRLQRIHLNSLVLHHTLLQLQQNLYMINLVEVAPH